MVLLTALFSCEKESEGLSSITYYIDITLTGETSVPVALGSDFAEPGYAAMEGESDATSKVVITDDIDKNAVGVYTVTYTAVNADGFPSTKERTVVVYDPTSPNTDLSGTYDAVVVRTESDGTNPRPRTSYIALKKVGTGVFYVNCLLGNYYAAGYGPAYEMRGYIKLNADNTFDLITSHVDGWNDGLEAFKSASYDPATGILYWESVYAGSDTFAATCTKSE